MYMSNGAPPQNQKKEENRGAINPANSSTIFNALYMDTSWAEPLSAPCSVLPSGMSYPPQPTPGQLHRRRHEGPGDGASAESPGTALELRRMCLNPGARSSRPSKQAASTPIDFLPLDQKHGNDLVL